MCDSPIISFYFCFECYLPKSNLIGHIYALVSHFPLVTSNKQFQLILSDLTSNFSYWFLIFVHITFNNNLLTFLFIDPFKSALSQVQQMVSVILKVIQFINLTFVS